jgi:DNA repair protein SbcC/Rad50
VFESIDPTEGAAGFVAKVDDIIFRSEDLSQGQRQDLAFAIFLARARAYGGTFFLDEPLLYLDDLNRVALLDVLRALAIQDGNRVRIVMTTASSFVLAHLRQKFKNVHDSGGACLLRSYKLSGTAKEGVQAELCD